VVAEIIWSTRSPAAFRRSEVAHRVRAARSQPPGSDTLPSEAILLTDFEMPGPNGVQLADAFRRAQPAAQAILLSAYTVPAIDGTVATRPWLRFMSKPLDYDVLHTLIHDL